MSTFLYDSPTLLIVAILFVLMISLHWAGFRLKRSRLRKQSADTEGGGSMEGSMLGLLALLLAFTFGMSSSRYDGRRSVLIQEANDIGTAILRADLYPDSLRNVLRNDFKQYLELRIAYFDAGYNQQKINASVSGSSAIASRLWKTVTQAGQQNQHLLATQQMVPALNSMFDTATNRDAARLGHVPESILWLLFLLTLTASFIIGYGTKTDKRDPIVVAGFALMTALTIYLILDLDRPRRGIITMDTAHEKMTELRDLLK